MSRTQERPPAELRSFGCSTCGRRTVIVGELRENPPCCICGGELLVIELPAGDYELVGQKPPSLTEPERAVDDRNAANANKASQPEADLGYGPSHGYDATHGGPTGPGDAPAK